VRVRIDGGIHELDAVPALDAQRRHTIEAVVDRLRIRQDAAQRLAESFETALRLSDGLAGLAFIDEPARAELLFSSRHACPVCGYSTPALEPKLFSFNNPAGACPHCGGLGVEEFFDPGRVVMHPHLSLAGGAVRGWDRHNEHYFQTIQALARHYRFDVETPWDQLPAQAREIVLHGSGAEAIRFRYVQAGGETLRRRHPFEGILPNLERRYRETGSTAVREALARYLATRSCPECAGTRLNRAARHVFVGGRTLPELSRLSIAGALEHCRGLVPDGWRGEIAARILREVSMRLGFLVDVGLGYLTLERSADTLSGGEAQRIRLASQVGSGLTGVMYVLDEPSIGLHARDTGRLLATLERLRDLGNTLIVVEHDAQTILRADYVVDLGPGAGVHGGEVVARGAPGQIMENDASLTGQYLAGRRTIAIPGQRTPRDPQRSLRVIGARGNNLRDLTVEFPIGLLTCVTGVSGSGKSTLVNDTLCREARTRLQGGTGPAAPLAGLEGLEQIDRIIDIDQSPIGRTPRSNPATYTGVFTPIRELFAQVPEARMRGYDAGRFSFNVKGGRCEACEGEGLIKVEMHFLPDVYVPCDACRGQRYNRETLDIRWRGRNICEVLELTVEDALRLFQNLPAIAPKLQTLVDVGLSYIRLGQSATTLSGGEAQRAKLARELARRASGRTLYVLDEPTTGLHFHDVAQLLAVLHRLRDEGNTVVVIEHNLDVIRTADWVVDLGPEGGAGGGRVLACGTPEQIAACEASYTGQALQPLLQERRPPRLG